MTATIDQFKALLAAFKELPPTPQRDPTTLELSGYPHLENVYSNILAFFLDPRREHGFGSLFLESLLSVAGYKEQEVAIQGGEEVEVNREEITGTRKQIDLVISTDTLIVGIENKIHQPLHNDLEDYGRHLDEKAKANGRCVCKILLGLNRPNNNPELFCFKPITYHKYFDEILRRIGHILTASKDRYLRFLLEVIETVNHLTEGSAMDPAMLDFFKNNKKGVESLLLQTNHLKGDMRKLVQQLKTDLGISGLQDRPIGQWCYKEEAHRLYDGLWYEININDDFKLVIYALISPKGWVVEAFHRGRGNRDHNSQRVKSWLETQEGNWKEDNGTRRYRLDLSADLSYYACPREVADRVRPLLESAMTDCFA